MPKGVYSHKRRTDDRICFFCHATKTPNKIVNNVAYPRWYRIDGNDTCQSCYGKKVTNLRVNRKRMLCYAGKQILLSFDIKRHICSTCGTTASSRFDTHHDLYVPIFPWLFTRELCISCHLKQGWNDRVYTHNQYNLYQVVRHSS